MHHNNSFLVNIYYRTDTGQVGYSVATSPKDFCEAHDSLNNKVLLSNNRPKQA